MRLLTILFIICFSCGLCYAQKKRNPNYKLEYRNVDSLSKLFTDSLKSAGITNIIGYRQTCSQCTPGTPEFDFVIWVAGGEYYVRKIDSYTNYYTRSFSSDIESPMAYYTAHKDSLAHEKLDESRGRTEYWLNIITIFENNTKYKIRFGNWTINSTNSTKKVAFLLTLIQGLVIRAEEEY